MVIPIYVVDAFTDSPFKGNQAGICFLDKSYGSIDESILQKIAFEMNLSETAFVSPINTKESFSDAEDFNLRWFTPTTEIDLCGHATLATAHVLFHELANSNKELKFHTMSGVLSVSKDEDFLKMDFPANPSESISSIDFISTSLGLQKEEIISWEYDPKLANVLVEVKNSDILQRIEPDFAKLKKYTGKLRIVGLIITAKMSETDFDFASRYFAPWVGINEDPVTGSSHTTLGPYWSAKLGKTELQTIQLSKRTGKLKLIVTNSRVYIKGKSCTILSGKFNF